MGKTACHAKILCGDVLHSGPNFVESMLRMVRGRIILPKRSCINGQIYKFVRTLFSQVVGVRANPATTPCD